MSDAGPRRPSSERTFAAVCGSGNPENGDYASGLTPDARSMAAAGKIRRIEIDFPEPVALRDDDRRTLDALLARICRRYEDQHPGRVMWPFGSGARMLANPLMLSDDEPIPFDDTIYHVEIAERADYECPCAHCGKPQGDHAGHIVDPPAGACEFAPTRRDRNAPAERPPRHTRLGVATRLIIAILALVLIGALALLHDVHPHGCLAIGHVIVVGCR